MDIKKQFVLRNIAGDFVLVPTGKTANEFKGLFPLTESGAKIWNMLPEAEDEAYITDKLLEEYDIDRETLSRDVKEFTDFLRQYGII